MKTFGQYGCLVNGIFAVFVFCTTASARIDANSPTNPGWDSFAYSAPKDLEVLPNRVWNESTDIFLKMDTITALALAGGASIMMHNTQINGDSIDNKIDDHYDDHPGWSNDQDEVYATIGGPGFHFAATGVWYALAAGAKNDFQRERAWTMMTALSITGATTLALKVAVNNRTPNDKALAWPSGHTASSFTVAAVLDEFYGPYVGIPAYAGAGFIGYRMVASGDHWASDVLFGGVLGYIVGHAVAGKHKMLEVGGFRLVPMMDSNASGLAMVKQF
jgi:membrane-associated phospholipid phosphatase